MTPAQINHLQLIDAHLDKLLTAATKRAPGRWKTCRGKHGTIIRLYKDTVGEPMDVCRAWDCSRKEGNTNFITACAGNAEAGWRSTKAVIKALINYSILDEHMEEMLTEILIAWPVAVITT